MRTTEINFKIGEEFEEQTVDGRPCKVRGREGHSTCLPCLSGSSFPRLFHLTKEPPGSAGCWKGAGGCLFSLSLAQALAVSSLASGLLQSLVKWERENKMVCEQRLLKGEGPKTSWSRELTNDGELILVSPAPSHPSPWKKPRCPQRAGLGFSCGRTPPPPDGGCFEVLTLLGTTKMCPEELSVF